MFESSVKVAVCVGALLAFCAAGAAADTTTRVYGPPGTGYTDETTNADGTVIRRQAFDDSGNETVDTHYDAQTGQPSSSSENHYDPEGNHTGTTHRDGEGEPTVRETFGPGGRLTERETFEEGVPSGRTDWSYDEDGNITDINVFDEDGNITTHFEYVWGEDGGLESAAETDHSKDPPEVIGTIFYDEDGNVTEQTGDVSGSLAQVGQSADPNTHTTTDADGNTIVVRHNDDGTYDVTVLHTNNQVTRGHLRHEAGCYLGDACPFGNPSAPSSNTDTADTSTDEPISQLPGMHTGGPPIDLPTHVPNVGTGRHNVPSVPGGRPGGGRYGPR